MLLNVLGPKIWMSILLLSWGTIMASTAAVKTGAQLMATRVLLGVAEAGLVPAILFYLSIWYTKTEQARIIAIFYAISTCAGVS